MSWSVFKGRSRISSCDVIDIANWPPPLSQKYDGFLHVLMEFWVIFYTLVEFWLLKKIIMFNIACIHDHKRSDWKFLDFFIGELVNFGLKMLKFLLNLGFAMSFWLDPPSPLWIFHFAMSMTSQFEMQLLPNSMKDLSDQAEILTVKNIEFGDFFFKFWDIYGDPNPIL